MTHMHRTGSLSEMKSNTATTNAAAPAKLLVRHPETKKFLRPTGRWTVKPEAAFIFPNPLSAIHTCISRGLDRVELLFCFDGDTDYRCVPVQCG